MGRGYSGADVLLDLELDYQYMGHEENEFGSIQNLIELNLIHATKDLSALKTDFNNIADNMENLAREFLEQNGNVDTGELKDSVHAFVNGDRITIHAPARDPKTGHLYAGHIEFGFTDRGGNPRGPWPFLRPAVHLAAQESTNSLGDSFARNLLYGSIEAMSFSSGRLAFGRSNKYIGWDRSNNLVRQTRRSFDAGRQVPGSRKNTKQWNSANHGIRAKDDDTYFITNDDSDWTWGNL